MGRRGLQCQWAGRQKGSGVESFVAVAVALVGPQVCAVGSWKTSIVVGIASSSSPSSFLRWCALGMQKTSLSLAFIIPVYTGLSETVWFVWLAFTASP